MRILGIETSCDETSAAVIKGNAGDKKVKLLSNVVASSLSLHKKTGGIIPESAAREQIKYIIPVLQQVLKQSRLTPKDFDAMAVTVGPGLIGSLLVGVETAKTLSYVWNKPLVPVNHLIGHVYANWLQTTKNQRLKTILFPALALIVSGGHTDLVFMKSHTDIKWLGGTKDDAAGEALDKIGRLLGLPYPAGPAIEKAAKRGNTNHFSLPRPMIGSSDFDFSFSGLKTAVLRKTQAMKQFNNETIDDLCASAQQAIIDVLIKKTLKAAQKYKVKSILLGGGVSANQKLREQLRLEARGYMPEAKIFAPQKFLCTDNAAMIAAAAFFNYKEVPWQKVTANPQLYFD